MRSFAGLLIPLLTLALFVAAMPAAVTAQNTTTTTTPAAPQQNEATRALHTLFDAEWERRMQENPTWASLLGDRRWNDQWGDASLAAIERSHQADRAALARLRQINRAQLSPADQLNYDLFEHQLNQSIEGYQYRWHLVPLNQRGGIQTANELSDSLRFANVRDYEDWIGRLRNFPAYMDQTMALMRAGMSARMLLPKIIMERVPAQIDRQIVANPQESFFYKPFTRFPDSIPQAERERLQAAAREAIAQNILPAYRRFKEFFVGEYLPASYDQVGAWQMPRGAEMYAFRTRSYTTTDMTPQQIHELGQREVRRIRAQMEEIKNQVGFRGTLQEFFAHLRTDPRYYYRTPEELLEAYRAMTRRIDPLLVRVFRRLPRMPYGVEPIPAAIAPDTTTAYYQRPAADGSRAGVYYVNLYRPETRPRYEMMALSLHEAVPGHHLQIALTQELGEVPNFRRYGGYTAFTEGWGLYAESLGDDMGLYDDPYSKFGQLTYEMWRAVRLVVDTGMHHMRWTRQQAIDFFKENAAKSELDIINEIDRYIAWPGQALAYKIGELKIKELRERAARELGANFDIRDFHDVVLGSGAVPLDILERNVNAWIAQQRQRPAQPPTPAAQPSPRPGP